MGEQAAASTAANGQSLNGQSLNGQSLNGQSLNGQSLNGQSLNGQSLNGQSLNGQSLNGSEITATDGTTTFGGGQVVGLEWDATLEDNTTARFAITGWQLLGTDINAYKIKFRRYGTNDWYWVCGTNGSGVPIQAILLIGYWNMEQGVPGGGAKIDDPDAITFACRGYALAKAVELGYRPWVSATYDEYHQATVRALRADFCGDGTPHTVDGTLINIYDNLNQHVQTDTQSGWHWPFEAKWTKDGAFCADAGRVNALGLPQLCLNNLLGGGLPLICNTFLVNKPITTEYYKAGLL